MKDDDEQYMNPWLEAGIVVLITLVSIAAFAFMVGYMT